MTTPPTSSGTRHVGPVDIQIDDGDDGPHARIPDWIADADISAQALRLYAVLSGYTLQGGSTYPSRRYLADRLRVKGLRTVSNAMAELRGIGALATLPLSRPEPQIRILPLSRPESAVTTHSQAARRRRADRRIQKAFRRIGERDGFYCRTCGIGRTLTVDHIIAVINDGSDEDENLQILCRSHNSIKGTR